MSTMTIPVGDARRAAVQRSLLWTYIAAALFVIFALVTTQWKWARSFSPWQDDPYDAVVSFTAIIVPLVTAAMMMRLVACRRDQALPHSRLRDLVRASTVVHVLVLATIAADWIAVAQGIHADVWDTVGKFLIAALMVLSLCVAGSACATWIVARRLQQATVAVITEDDGPDWLDDGLLLLQRLQHLRWGKKIITPIYKIAHSCVTSRFGIKQHPVVAAGVTAIAAGGIFSTVQGVQEGYSLAVMGLFATIYATGLFAAMILIGTYVHFVARPSRPQWQSQRLLPAAVLATFSVPVAVAFRDQLWWVIGTNANDADVAQFALLIGVFAVGTGLLAFLAAAVVRRVRSGQRP